MSNLIPRDDSRGRSFDSRSSGGPTFEYTDPERGPAGYHGTDRRNGPDDTIELGEVLMILRRRMGLIALCVAAGLGLAFAIHQVQDPRYRATAVISVEDPRGQMSAQLVGMERMGGPGTANPIRSALEVLRSRAVLGEIVEQEGLRLVPLDAEVPAGLLSGVRVGEFALPDTLSLRFTSTGIEAHSSRIGEAVSAGYGQQIQLGDVAFRVPERPPVPEASFIVLQRDEAIAEVERNLSAQLRAETNVVDVSFTAADREQAQRTVNRAVLAFQARSTAEARGESQRRRVFLEEQLAQADTTLRLAQAHLTEFRSTEQVVSSQQQGATEQSGLMSIEMRREELRADRGMYQSILGQLATAAPGEMGERLQAIVATPEVAANPVVSTLHQQLMEFEAEREALTSGPWGLSERNPDVARIDQQIASTRGRLESAVRSHMDNLDARIAAMDALRNRTAAQVSGRPGTLAEEERLLQTVESIRRTVDQLREEFYRAQMAEAVEEGPVQIVDLAPLPRESERAGLPLMLALGFMLGAMVGAGGAFLVEMLNTKVRRQEDVQEAMRVGTIGIIPRLPTATSRKLKAAANGKAKKGGSMVPGVPGGVANGHGSAGGEMVTIHDTRSAEAEAFRTLRTNLLFARGHDRLRSIVVGSAMPGEGKTTTAANLAVTYAQQGLQVVLVDCDLRKPRIGELFGVDRKPGLTELVLGEATIEETVRPFGPIEGLHILPAGTLPPNPTELLGGARTREMLRTLRERFDMVVLDTPPLAGGADSAILGASVDGVIMVVKAGSTELDAARHAAHQLHTVGANLIGAVVNDPDGEVEKYGSYYHSEYYGEAV